MNVLDKQNFIKAVIYIYDHLHAPITIPELSDHCLMSEGSLKRLFHHYCDCSPSQFIRRLRLNCAMQSLQQSDDSVLKIALQNGFENHAAFSRCVKQLFGNTPTQLRQTQHILEADNIVLDEPEILDLAEQTVWGVTRQGYYYQCAPEAWHDLRDILNREAVLENFNGLYIGIGHDNPHATGQDEQTVRFTAACGFEDLSAIVPIPANSISDYGQESITCSCRTRSL